MDYAYAVKALPDNAAPSPEPGSPEPDQQPVADDGRPWAGDPYDEGDESDPAQANSAFSGPGGEEAWLDKAPDGTLTGWVRDDTGQVWRYSDADAWAIDVDDAGMTQTHGPDGQVTAADGQQDAEPSDNGTSSGDAAPSEPRTEEEAPPLALGFTPADEQQLADPESDPAADPSTAEDPDADEEEAPKKRGKGGKKPRS
ncbi:hypothetical protein ABZ726_00245 [Streptomyces hundungensis]|uniref:hypothetical protein n=1 Tax=Streptomyces hundungensis TaxID=1077946 RepID=UPI00340B35C1